MAMAVCCSQPTLRSVKDTIGNVWHLTMLKLVSFLCGLSLGMRSLCVRACVRDLVLACMHVDSAAHIGKEAQHGTAHLS